MVRLFPREASSASYEGEQASGNFLGTKCFEPIYQVKLLPKTLPFTYQSLYHKQNALGVPPQHVDSSAPTILPQWVRVPSTPSTLLSFIVFVLYLQCEKNENKQKEGEFGPLKKQNALQHNSEIKHSDWLKLVKCLAISNQTAVIQQQ